MIEAPRQFEPRNPEQAAVFTVNIQGNSIELPIIPAHNPLHPNLPRYGVPGVAGPNVWGSITPDGRYATQVFTPNRGKDDIDPLHPDTLVYAQSTSLILPIDQAPDRVLAASAAQLTLERLRLAALEQEQGLANGEERTKDPHTNRYLDDEINQTNLALTAVLQEADNRTAQDAARPNPYAADQAEQMKFQETVKLAGSSGPDAAEAQKQLARELSVPLMGSLLKLGEKYPKLARVLVASSVFLSACGGAGAEAPAATPRVTTYPTATTIRPTEAPPTATSTAIPPSPTAAIPPTPEIRVTPTPTFRNGTVSSLEQAAYFRRTDDASALALAEAFSKTNGLVTPVRLADGTITYPGVDIQTSTELRDGKVVSGSTYSFGIINEGPNKGALIGYTYATERDPATGALLISSTQKDNPLALRLTPKLAEATLGLNIGQIASVGMQREKGAFVARDSQGRIVGVLDIETVDGKPPVWRAFDTVEFDGKTGRYVNRASQVITGTVANLQPTPTAVSQEVSKTIDSLGNIEVYPDSSKLDFRIVLTGSKNSPGLDIRVGKGLLPDAKNHLNEIVVADLGKNTRDTDYFMYQNPDGTPGGFSAYMFNRVLLGFAMRDVDAENMTLDLQQKGLKEMQTKYLQAVNSNKPFPIQMGIHYLDGSFSTDDPLSDMEKAVKSSKTQDIRSIDLTKTPIYHIVKPNPGVNTANTYGVLGGVNGAAYAVDKNGRLSIFYMMPGGVEAKIRDAEVAFQNGVPRDKTSITMVVFGNATYYAMKDIAASGSLITGQPFRNNAWNTISKVVGGGRSTIQTAAPLNDLIPYP